MDVIVPTPLEEATVEMSDGATILLRRHGTRNRPCLVFSHGNGLAIDAYADFLAQFEDTHDVIVFDMRNHGRNPPCGSCGHDWGRMTRDVHELHRAVTQAFAIEPVAGVFHSLSAVSAMRAAVHHGVSWPHLVLFDPPICPRPDHELVALHEADVLRQSERARRRPEIYPHWRDFAAQLRSRPQFGLWRSGAHERFARATLREDQDTASYSLVCPREYEARIFETNLDDTLWGSVVDGLGVPVSIIGADPDLADADAPALVCAALAVEAGLDYDLVAGTTHMLQLEQPEACADLVLNCLARHREF